MIKRVVSLVQSMKRGGGGYEFYLRIFLVHKGKNGILRLNIFVVHNSNKIHWWKYLIVQHHEIFYKNVTIIIYNLKKIIKYNKI